MKTFPTTMLQIFCKFIFNYKDIVKSILVLDDNSCRDIFPAVMVAKTGVVSPIPIIAF